MKNIVATPALHHVAPGIQADMRIITPEVAQELLGRNTRNRVVSSASLPPSGEPFAMASGDPMVKR